MRKTALIIGIMGLGLLIAILLKDPKSISSLDNLKIGEVVRVEGLVENQRKFSTGQLLIIDEMPVYCECQNSYVGKSVSIEGIIEKFPDDLRIKAFKIQILD